MIRGEFEDVGEHSPTSLREACAETLAQTVESVGIETVRQATALDSETLTELDEQTMSELTLEQAAAILGTDDQRPDADTILTEARDILLIGMSTAVLDVEAVAAGIDDAMDPKEIQQKIEGRHPMTVAEYALLYQYIESEKR